jgi:thymidylate synthase
MTHVIKVRNVAEALPAGLRYLGDQGTLRYTRAGPALTAPGPVATVYENSWECVLHSAVRDANPFFHLAEAVWMLAGRDDAAFLNHYVKNFGERFAEADGRIHGAYGARWRDAQGFDQLPVIINMLKRDPETRQAVLQMWDAGWDDLSSTGWDDLRGNWRDRPCNTHVYFRVRNGVLDMTVCCRSNDILMGCLAGDTSIKSPEGDLSIRSLTDRFNLGLKRFPVYAVDPKTGDMAIKWCTRAWKTGVKPVLELIFDDGSTLKLTGDHKLYKKKTRRGVTSILGKVMIEIPVRDLRVGDRIWAPWVDQKGGRAIIKKNILGNTSFDNTQFVYRAYDEFLRGPKPDGIHVHHDDEDVTNDKESNLIRLTQAEHMALHARARMLSLSKEERRDRATIASKAAKVSIKNMCEEERAILTKKQTEHSKRTMTNYWKGISPEERKTRVKKASEAAAKVVSPEEKREAARRGRASRWSDPEQRRRQSELMRRLNQENRMRANHKIVEIRELPPEDVYDFTVEDYHTALVGNGVLAHNCYGANAVHFGFLHAYVAGMSSYPAGVYTQFSNDYHAYIKDLDKLALKSKLLGLEFVIHKEVNTPRQILALNQLAEVVSDPRYTLPSFPLVENPATFDVDLRHLVHWVDQLHVGTRVQLQGKNTFLLSTVAMALLAHHQYKQGDLEGALLTTSTITSTPWRLACQEWLRRRKK